MADDQRIRPTVQGRARLLQAVAAVAPAHVIDPGALGEYAQLVAESGRAHADRQVPDVAAHLAGGCAACGDDLRELLALIQDEAPPRAAEDSGVGTIGLVSAGQPAAGRPQTVQDSGVHERDLRDPRTDEARAAAEAHRRQQLRLWRERLLIAAAVAVLLMGLSLIALAYVSRDTPRLDLAPAPAATSAPSNSPAAPAQPAPSGAPAQSAPAMQPAPAKPGASGFAPPSGSNCPPTHPIKGNRNSGIYHVPGGSLYEATRPEQCFAQPSDAEAAGYRRSQR